MTHDEKKTAQIKLHVSERVNFDLTRLARAEDRKLSDFIGRVLTLYLYGHSARWNEINEIVNRADDADGRAIKD